MRKAKIKAMTFDIRFTSESSDNIAYGEIVLNDFREKFEIPTIYWERKEYEVQWHDAVERVVEADGDIDSMLMTSMYNPNNATFLFSWPFYKAGRKVYFQNCLIMLENLERKFDESSLYEFVPRRETTSDSGEPVSEWEISIADLKQWFSRTQ